MATRRDVLGMLAAGPMLLRSPMASGAVLGSMPEPVGDLARAFVAPPDSTRPYVLWMWMGSNISREGITRDLEAMRDAGIGGATIFSLADTVTPWSGVILKSPTPEVVTFSEPWWKLVRFAATECRRLGLELLLHNCAGYETSGGPWITPELSMQEVVWSEQRVTGGHELRLSLPKAKIDPRPHQDWPKVYIPAQGDFGIPLSKARETYYRDIAVLAVPATGVVRMDQVLDLSGSMSAGGDGDGAGNLNWNAPPGEWTIYRFGHTSTGSTIEPAQWDAMGLECDKMSEEAVTFHCRHVLEDIKRHVGDLIGNPGLSTLYFDSYEAGVPNWTPKMREQFQARRGYDLTPYLAVLAGRTLGSEAQTARFREDLKRTVKDLYRDCYWATPRKLAHEYGLKFVAEPYDGPWEVAEVMPFLDHANLEFWTHGGKYSPVFDRPVSDAAHALGQRIVGAEAFTSDPKESGWQATPAWLKPVGDAAFCAGVNRMNVHHFVQQPWAEPYRPGNTMGQWGVHMGRYQTWWEPGKAWFRYLWRCQTLLQAGEFVAPSAQTSCVLTSQDAGLEVKSIHRLHGREHLYFVANLSPTAQGTATCTFPVTDLRPELWDAVWGTMRPLQATVREGRTAVVLEFAPGQSWFVVFRKPHADSAPLAAPVWRTLLEVDGRWEVQFDPAWGGPAAAVPFDVLSDWSQHAQPGIQHYSGTAVYRKTLRLAAGTKKLWLDLGVVKDIATVTVNGRRLGVVWTAPWRIDISSAVVAGDNRIEIAVANTWANRLIGDEQQPADVIWEQGDAVMKGGYFLKEFPEWFLKNEPRPSKGRYTFTTWNYFHDKNAALLPAGLLGPVRVMEEG